jgi:hypothetical protein
MNTGNYCKMSVPSRFRTALTVGLLAASIMVCLIAGGTVIVGEWWIPNRRIQDIDYLSHADANELRSTAHQVLRLPAGHDHDACLMLFGVGNRTSIPYLRKAIRRNQRDDGVVICTESHCRDALRRVLTMPHAP